MLIYCPRAEAMFSTIYGNAGSKELRSKAKKMRLDRGFLRSEGHPVNEHYMIPAAKQPGIADRGILSVHADDLRRYLAVKDETLQQAMTQAS